MSYVRHYCILCVCVFVCVAAHHIRIENAFGFFDALFVSLCFPTLFCTALICFNRCHSPMFHCNVDVEMHFSNNNNNRSTWIANKIYVLCYFSLAFCLLPLHPPPPHSFSLSVFYCRFAQLHMHQNRLYISTHLCLTTKSPETCPTCYNFIQFCSFVLPHTVWFSRFIHTMYINMIIIAASMLCICKLLEL